MRESSGAELLEVTGQGNIMEDGHVDCVVRDPEGVECRE